MKHRSTIAIFSEWQRLAFDRNDDLERGFQAPQRTDVEPRRLGRHLSDLFFVEADGNGELVFRLGGTRICTLFGRELKGVRLLSLWPERIAPDVALADEAVKAAIFTVNASNRTRQWTETRIATPPMRKAPHLRVINGGKA
jgi:hypothetical protein